MNRTMVFGVLAIVFLALSVPASQHRESRPARDAAPAASQPHELAPPGCGCAARYEESEAPVVYRRSNGAVVPEPGFIRRLIDNSEYRNYFGVGFACYSTPGSICYVEIVGGEMQCL